MQQLQTHENDRSRGDRMRQSWHARQKRSAQKKDRWTKLLATAYELDKNHASGTKLSPTILAFKQEEERLLEEHGVKRRHGEKSPFQSAHDLIEAAKSKRKKLRLHWTPPTTILLSFYESKEWKEKRGNGKEARHCAGLHLYKPKIHPIVNLFYIDKIK